MAKRPADMHESSSTACPELKLFNLTDDILSKIVSLLDINSSKDFSETCKKAWEIHQSEKTWGLRVQNEFFQGKEIAYPYRAFPKDESKDHYQRYYKFLKEESVRRQLGAPIMGKSLKLPFL